jgi:myo-inositol-1(or 4)-monophosphatase
MSPLELERRVLRAVLALDWARLLNADHKRLVTRRPVSDQLAVDVALHEVLCPLLRGIHPAPVVSEESPRTKAHPRSYWLVDPLDGTNEFRAGIPEFATSIAFVKAGTPVAGVIFNPCTGEYFSSSEARIRRSFAPSLRKPQFLISRSEHAKRLHHSPRAISGNYVPVGSVAYKLGLISAVGGRLGMVSYRPKSAWDIGAGAAILRNRLGVELSTMRGKVISFSDPWARIPSLLVSPSATLPT